LTGERAFHLALSSPSVVGSAGAFSVDGPSVTLSPADGESEAGAPRPSNIAPLATPSRAPSEERADLPGHRRSREPLPDRDGARPRRRGGDEPGGPDRSSCGGRAGESAREPDNERRRRIPPRQTEGRSRSAFPGAACELGRRVREDRTGQGRRQSSRFCPQRAAGDPGSRVRRAAVRVRCFRRRRSRLPKRVERLRSPRARARLPPPRRPPRRRSRRSPSGLENISMTMRLTGEKLSVVIRAASSQTAGSIEGARDAISDRLAAIGQPLDSLIIRQTGVNGDANANGNGASADDGSTGGGRQSKQGGSEQWSSGDANSSRRGSARNRSF
jgi:hypothetical protein